MESAMRWHLKLMMLKKRNLDASCRDNIIRVIQFKCRGFNADIIAKLRTQIKSQINHLHSLLRSQFDAAVRQFNEDPASQPWRDWFEKAVALVKSLHKLAEPYIESSDVDKYFLKDDLELVSDIWAPILDVVEPKFLMKPMYRGFAQVFTTATRDIFAEFLTITLKSSGQPMFDANTKTNAILSVDLQNFWKPQGQWPAVESLNRPDPWKKFGPRTRVFGKLKHSKYSTQVKSHDVQAMIEDKRNEPAILPPASLSVPSEHVGRITLEHVKYFKELCKSDVAALEDILTTIERRKEQVLAAVREGERWSSGKKNRVATLPLRGVRGLRVGRLRNVSTRKCA
jgi:hypothetical protein